MKRDTFERLKKMGIDFDDDFENLMVKPLEKQSEKIEEKKEEENLITGYWSLDKLGKKPIAKANLGQIVYFHINNINVKNNTTLKLQLLDEDIINDDDKFPINDNENNLVNKKIVKYVNIQDNRGFLELKLEENWSSLIYEDFQGGFLSVKIELYWKVLNENFEQKIPNILNVYHSSREIYLNPPINGYNLPELLTINGETIIFSAGSALEVNDKVIEVIDDARYFIGARALKKGKILTNIGEIYQKKKKIYTYNLYNNSGKEFELTMASNFGFKSKYVNNGKLVTTKGISQIDYFSNKGVVNETLKFSKNIIELWDLKDLFDIMYKDDFSGDIPASIIPNPLSFSYDLLVEFVVKPFAQNVINELKQGFNEDFEIYKQKGLQQSLEFIKKPIIKNLFKTIDIYYPQTLQRILTGKFTKISEIKKYDDSIGEKDNFKNSSKHTIFFKVMKDKYRNNMEIFFLDCIFLNDKILK